MKVSLTNQHDMLKFIAFLAEGLPYVDMWTPTRISEGGCGVFAKLLVEKLKEVGIESKIFAIFFEEDRHDPRIKNLENYLRDGSDVKDAAEDHIVIKVLDSFYVDSRGLLNMAVNLAW